MKWGFWLMAAAAAALGLALVWASSSLEGKWLGAVSVGVLLFSAAVISGRFEKVLFAVLFLVLPFNVDVQVQAGSTIRQLGLSSGSSILGVSTLDILLLLLIPFWVIRTVSERRPASWPAGMWVLLAVIGWGVVATVNATYADVSFFQWINFLKAVLLYTYVAANVRTRAQWRLALVCLMIGLVLEGLVGVAQYVAGGNLGLAVLGERAAEKGMETSMGKVFRIGGTLGHPNYLGGYLVSLLPLALGVAAAAPERALRWLGRGALGLCVLTLVLSYSRSAWVTGAGALAVFILWILRSRRLKIRRGPLTAALALMGIAAAAFAPVIYARMTEEDYGSTESRFQQARTAAQMVAKHPWAGVGMNNYTYVLHLYDSALGDPEGKTRVYVHQSRVHNSFLLMAAEMGFVGVGLWGLFLALVLWAAWRHALFSSDTLVAVSKVGIALGLIARLFHDAGHTAYFVAVPSLWVLAGLAAAKVSDG